MMWPWEQARRNSSTGKSDEKDPLERSRNRPYIGVERWLHIVLGGCWRLHGCSWYLGLSGLPAPALWRVASLWRSWDCCPRCCCSRYSPKGPRPGTRRSFTGSRSGHDTVTHDRTGASARRVANKLPAVPYSQSDHDGRRPRDRRLLGVHQMRPDMGCASLGGSRSLCPLLRVIVLKARRDEGLRRATPPVLPVRC